MSPRWAVRWSSVAYEQKNIPRRSSLVSILKPNSEERSKPLSPIDRPLTFQNFVGELRINKAKKEFE